eukprot:1137507-Pelagomonas_calceolata.AAC.2
MHNRGYATNLVTVYCCPLVQTVSATLSTALCNNQASEMQRCFRFIACCQLLTRHPFEDMEIAISHGSCCERLIT